MWFLNALLQRAGQDFSISGKQIIISHHFKCKLDKKVQLNMVKWHLVAVPHLISWTQTSSIIGMGDLLGYSCMYWSNQL